jgi:hypothetical protein
MVGLASAIQRREVTFPPGVIVDELECFEYEYKRRGCATRRRRGITTTA